MKTKFYFVAALAATMLASCADDKFVGDNSPNELQENAGVGINFGLNVPGRTRADIYGGEAAKLLGNNFYVMGTKGTEPDNSPTTTVVFDNYLVHWAANTAGNKESNTANWDYVGIDQGATPDKLPADYNRVKLSTILGAQTIKYWDYSEAQYDFFAFSTGPNAAVKSTTPSNNQIGITEGMLSGASLASGATAYTLYIPRVEDLKETYITDIKEVSKTDYGKEVTLQFKNIGAKIRVALYETVPGYSVKDVKFYSVEYEGTVAKPTDLGSSTSTNATLISASSSGFTTKGSIAVSFPYVGNLEQKNQAYDKADAVVSATEGVKTQTFGELSAQYTGSDRHEANNNIYLGRTLPTATFAGSKADNFYQTVFPATGTTNALTLRVDYTLVSIDGSGETINVYGANAVVPATYTKWKPNYAYTYIFKISDNSNGWTSKATTTDPAGLFPITFDAVVTAATDATAEQTTVTTVATPSITTYQQYHDKANNEYSKTVKNLKNEDQDRNLYVQVMDNSISTATLVGVSPSSLPALGDNTSLIYQLSEKNASEAQVMDALQMRTTTVGTIKSEDITGRNGLGLTNVSEHISNNVTTIINGADDKPIENITSGTTAMIDISELTKDKSYAYVYISKAKSKDVKQFEPVNVTVNSAINGVSTDKFYKLDVANAAGTILTAAKAPNEDYLYFSVLKDGTGAVTGYSYISPSGKTTMPIGCKEIAKSLLDVAAAEVTGEEVAATGFFYFYRYYTNDAEYAVKVFKVVE